MYTAAKNFFGPDYSGNPEFVGSFTIKANQSEVDVTYKVDGLNMSVLPPGGYLLKYVEGSYLILSNTPTFLTIGGKSGLHVSWMCNKSTNWSTAPFNISYEATDAKDLRRNANPDSVDHIMQLEFTRPHRLRLMPPEKAAGHVKIKVMRYVSQSLMQPTAEQLVQGIDLNEPVS